MRGEVCIGFASLLSLISMIMLALVYAGQTRSSSVPRSISMATVDVSDYHQGLFAAFDRVIPIEGLYAQDASARLGDNAGLRREYRFGVTNYCGYVDDGQGSCGRQNIAAYFRPYSIITSDMPTNYSQFANAVIPLSNFRSDNLLGSFARTAGYMLLLAFVFTGLSLIMGVIKTSCTFMLSAYCCLLGSIFLLLGGVLWTVAIKKAQFINGQTISATPNSTPSPVGIIVSSGPGLSLIWAAYALMVTATIPYVITCCTYRS